MLPSEKATQPGDAAPPDEAASAIADAGTSSSAAGPAALTAMRQRIDALAEELRQARQLDAAKTAFLAMVSHELRTPLNAITGFSDAALHGVHGPMPEAYRSYFAAINGVGRHLDALVGNLLDLAQIEIGRFSIAPERVEARALVEEACVAVAPIAEHNGIDLAVAIFAEDWRIEADPMRVRQILVNLLANAIKFTPRDGRVGIEAAPSPATTAEGGASLDLTVWDTGIGIAAEHQERIFEAFYQLSSKPLGSRGKGVGLGLAIARQLAQAMRGDIILASAPGYGSRFTLRLPLATDEGA
jgi:signal transduction histidine kinase